MIMKKLLLIFLVAILLVPQVSLAAIAFDNSTQGLVGSASSLTFAHTVSGANRILFVAATVNTGATVSGVTYNGTALTLIDTKAEASGPTTYLYYLIAPAAGTNNVVISASASTNIIGTASSYTGAAQTGQPDASTVHAGAVPVTAYSKSLTTIADNSWVVSTTRTGNGHAQTADAGTTIREQPETTYLGGGSFWDSGGPVTPAGSKALGVTVGAAENFLGAIMASFAPAPDEEPVVEGITWFFF